MVVLLAVLLSVSWANYEVDGKAMGKKQLERFYKENDSSARVFSNFVYFLAVLCKVTIRYFL